MFQNMGPATISTLFSDEVYTHLNQIFSFFNHKLYDLKEEHWNKNEKKS